MHSLTFKKCKYFENICNLMNTLINQILSKATVLDGHYFYWFNCHKFKLNKPTEAWNLYLSKISHMWSVWLRSGRLANHSIAFDLFLSSFIQFFFSSFVIRLYVIKWQKIYQGPMVTRRSEYWSEKSAGFCVRVLIRSSYLTVCCF